MKFEQLLVRNVRGFWATSYSFGLKLFDQYLLRKLSQNTLNTVVLADHDKLADVWEHLAANERYLARRAGSRYLLRGIRPVGGGAFHAKTYLFVRADDATLVVGSGNLTRDGIDGGREVFTSFSTTRDADLPSLRAWAAWMSRTVQSHGDGLLRERWEALRDTCPWMLGSTDGSALLVNDDRALIDQLRDRVSGPTEELHVTAPFFDRNARALEKLIQALNPERVLLYAGAGMTVDGPSLAKVLGRTGQAKVFSYEPRTFVHAKLIGAVSDGLGTLLTGSPNLSQAALTLTSADEYGNSETAVIRDGTAEQVRAVFQSSGLQLIERPLESLDALEFEDDHPTTARPLVLRTATWRKDGRVELKWAGMAPAANATFAWDEHTSGVAIDDQGVTVEAVNDREPLPLIGWLTDSAEYPLSNRVALDDPAALHEALTGSDRKASSRPSELEGLEMAPLVRLALWAHDKFIFDVDDTAAIRRANDAAAENAGDQDISDFWDQYAKAELEYDARAHTYRPLTGDASGRASTVDELLRELQVLLHASPTSPHPVLRALTASGEPDDEDREPQAGTPWTMEARQRVRAYNLLTRWCDAVADPRHALVAADAPVINYQTLLGVLLLAWVHKALDEVHLRRLLLKLLAAFVGDAPGHGFLGRVDDADRSAALERLDPFMAEVAAGLVAVALAPSGPWRQDIYDWQPVLGRGIEYGVILPDDWSATVVERTIGAAALTDDVDELLVERLAFIDDRIWGQRLAAELGLKSVSLLRRNSPVGTGVSVDGLTDALHDGRLLTVARQSLDHKKVAAIAVNCGDNCLMIFEPGKLARARVGTSILHSSGPVDAVRLREIEEQGGSWADLLDAERSVAA